MACPQAPAQIWAGSSTLDDRRQEEKAAGSLFLKILEVQCCSRFSGPVSAGVLPVVQQPLRAVGEGGLAWASHVLKWPLPQAEKTPWEQGRHSPRGWSWAARASGAAVGLAPAPRAGRAGGGSPEVLRGRSTHSRRGGTAAVTAEVTGVLLAQRAAP